ncbi:MAG: hypothetical protein L0G22_01110 [Propionibacteriaceae bacterium]|nr:hypothetical protein [Propionibacteriaceae bacterium]
MVASDGILAAEWIKGRTIPESWAFSAGALVLGVGWATAPALLNRTRFAEQIAAAGADADLGPLFWLGVTRLTIVVALVLGAVLLTGERESGTAVVTRTVAPHPVGVYAAKVAVATAWGFAIGLVSGLGVPLGVRLALGPVAAPITTAPAVFAGYGLRVAVITALCAALGVAIAALTRSLLVSAVIGFVWVWFENQIASLFGEFANLGVLTPWRNLSYFIDTTGYDLPYLWSYHWGFAPLAVLTVVLLVAGAWRHRDDTNTIKE